MIHPAARDLVALHAAYALAVIDHVVEAAADQYMLARAAGPLAYATRSAPRQIETFEELLELEIERDARRRKQFEQADEYAIGLDGEIVPVFWTDAHPSKRG